MKVFCLCLDHTRPPFGASLKEFRDVWCTFIKEMVAGYEIAEGKSKILGDVFLAFMSSSILLMINLIVLFAGLKDEQVIRQAAQNVIIADALLKK